MTTRVWPALMAPSTFLLPATTLSPPSTRSAPAAGDADGVDLLRRIGDADMAVDRAALLREAGHVDDAGALAFQMRGHADDGADGDDAGAADAGDDDAVGMIGQRQLGSGSAGQFAGSATPSPFLSLAPCTVTKDGQKPLTQE